MQRIEMLEKQLKNPVINEEEQGKFERKGKGKRKEKEKEKEKKKERRFRLLMKKKKKNEIVTQRLQWTWSSLLIAGSFASLFSNSLISLFISLISASFSLS